MTKKEKKGNLAYRIGVGFNNWMQKYMPDSLTIALLLALLVFIICMAVTGTGPIALAGHFTDGMWNLLSFGMQVCVMMLFSAILAKTKPVSKFMNKLADIPKNAGQAYVLGVIMFMIINAIQSTFEIPFAAIYAKTVSKKVKGVHFPYILALGYVAEMMWQCAIGGTIPLLSATEGSYAAEAIGRVVPLSETILSKENIIITVILFVTIPIIAKLMAPKDENEIVEYDPSQHEDEVFVCERPENPTFAQKIMFSRIPSLVFGIIALIPAVLAVADKGINALNINTVNLILFALCLIMVDHPAELVKRIGNSSAAAGPTIAQFPIYAGIMGMMTGSGLAKIIVGGLASIATAQTLPNIVNLSSGILNFVIPSCGSKFSIEAPIFFAAANELGTNIPNLIMANAWGDAILKIMHPFYALPILAIGKVEAKDILGYTTVFALYALIVVQIVLFLCNSVFI